MKGLTSTQLIYLSASGRRCSSESGVRLSLQILRLHGEKVISSWF